MTTERKATEKLKPWWDVLYSYSLMALLGLGFLLLLTSTSGYSTVMTHDAPQSSPTTPASTEKSFTTVTAKDGTDFFSPKSFMTGGDEDAAEDQKKDDTTPMAKAQKVTKSPSNQEEQSEQILQSHESVFSVYTITLFSCLWLMEAGYSRCECLAFPLNE